MQNLSSPINFEPKKPQAEPLKSPSKGPGDGQHANFITSPSTGSYTRQNSKLYLLVSGKLPNPKKLCRFYLERSRIAATKYTERSLLVFQPTHPIRRFLLLLAENKLFDRFILVCIVINCVFLAMDDNPPEDPPKYQLLFWSELAFNILYTIEMIVKVIAWGLLYAGHRSYLNSAWNVLDMIVVIGGWLNLFLDGASNLAALRSLRLLKPLKAIGFVPGMKVQVKALLSSIPSLLNVLALMTFLLFVFGILGMQLLGGKLRHRCVVEGTGTSPDNPFIIANNTDSQIYGLCSLNADYGVQCEAGTVCADIGSNPNNDVTSFDNILISWLTILQCISLEGWTDVMYMIDETSGHWFDVYFVLLILLGSLFVINLIVAVIFIRFKAFKELEQEKMKRRENTMLAATYDDSPVMKKEKAAATRGKLLSNLDRNPSDFFTDMSSTVATSNKTSANIDVDGVEDTFEYVEADDTDTDHDHYHDDDANDNDDDKGKKGDDTASLAPPDGHKEASHVKPAIIPPSKDDIDGNQQSSVVVEEQEHVEEEQKKNSNEDDTQQVEAEEEHDDEELPSQAIGLSSLEIAQPTREPTVKQVPLRSLMTMKSLSTRMKSFHEESLRPASLWIVDRPYFDTGIILAILLNSVILSLERYPMSDELDVMLRVSNYVFSGIFAIEMLLKIIGFGLADYLEDQWNLFDCVIVIVSIVDISMPSSNSSFTALRAFRLLKVFKLVKFLHGLKELLETVLDTLTDLKYFSFILGLFIFIYALVGAQYFQGQFTFDGETSRANFDTILWSLVTVFQILTGENWNEVLYDGVRGSGWWSCFYFISCFTIGNYIVLSLFMAILLGNFENVPPDKENEKFSKALRYKMKKTIQRGLRSMSAPFRFVWKKLKRVCINKNVSPVSPASESKSRSSSSGRDRQLSTNKNIGNKVAPDDDPDLDTDPDAAPLHDPVDGNAFNLSQMDSTTVYLESPRYSSCFAETVDEDTIAADIEIPSHEVALHCISSDCFVRHVCIKMLENDWFERFVMALIFISSVFLCLDEPNLDPDSTLAAFLLYADWIITMLFTLEMIIKIIAMGLIGHEKAYLRSGWNRVDCFIVIVSIINLFLSGLSFVKGFRALRALRPLRMISRFENMKLVVNSIFATIPALGNVFIITILFFYIFGIIGVQQFKGLYWYCVDVEASGNDHLVILDKDEAECIGANERWQQNRLGNFDNIFSSMLILFVVATLENWPLIMYAAIDARGPGLAPERDANPARAIFFIVFLLVCSFFVLSLFVGVVVDEYHKYHEQFTHGFITDSQKEWLESVRRLLNVNTSQQLTVPQQRFRKLLYRIVTDEKFELAISILIGLNILVMSLSYYDAPQSYEHALNTLNQVFTYIFVAEMLLKWLGLGLRQYFRNAWNQFDALIVFLSLAVLIIEGLGDSIDMGFDPTIARVLRILRIFRVVKRAKSLHQLLETLVFSLPALYNVGLLLLLLFFIYSVAGMSLFGKVLLGEYMNQHANFQTFGTSMLTLYRMSTGESWNGIFHDCSITESNSNCTAEDENCGSPFFATVYFCTFYVLSAMVMLNVFVAVVLKNFEEQISATSKDVKLPPGTMDEFEKLWLKFCEPDAETMRVARLTTFLNLLVEPLGLLTAPKFGKEAAEFIKTLDVPVYDGKIHYMDLGTALTLRVYGVETSRIPEQNEFMKYLRSQMFRKFPKLKTFRTSLDSRPSLVASVGIHEYGEREVEAEEEEEEEEEKQEPQHVDTHNQQPDSSMVDSVLSDTDNVDDGLKSHENAAVAAAQNSDSSR